MKKINKPEYEDVILSQYVESNNKQKLKETVFLASEMT